MARSGILGGRRPTRTLCARITSHPLPCPPQYTLKMPLNAGAHSEIFSLEMSKTQPLMLDSLLRAFPTRCSVVLLAAGLSRRLVSYANFLRAARWCVLAAFTRPSVRPSVCLCCAPRVLVLVRIVCRRALVLVLRSLCARAVLVPCLCCGVLVFCVRGCVVPRVLARVCVWAGVPLACRRRLHRRSHLRPPPWSELRGHLISEN